MIGWHDEMLICPTTAMLCFPERTGDRVLFGQLVIKLVGRSRCLQMMSRLATALHLLAAIAAIGVNAATPLQSTVITVRAPKPSPSYLRFLHRIRLCAMYTQTLSAQSNSNCLKGLTVLRGVL